MASALTLTRKEYLTQISRKIITYENNLGKHKRKQIKAACYNKIKKLVNPSGILTGNVNDQKQRRSKESAKGATRRWG